MDETAEGSLSWSDLGSVQEPSEDVSPRPGKTQKGVCGCRLLQVAVCAAPPGLAVISKCYYTMPVMSCVYFSVGIHTPVIAQRDSISMGILVHVVSCCTSWCFVSLLYDFA